MSTETRRINGILKLLRKYPSTSGAGLNASVGLQGLDDCAVVPLNSQQDLVFGSDFVRGPGFHLFRKGILSWQDIGFYLIGANASDIAAMGASPIGVVVVLRYTSDMSDEDYSDVMEGVLRACKEFSIPLLGGDTGGYDSPVLSAAAIGICPSGKALLRSQGCPGDELYVTGDIGRAGAALAYFTRGKEEGLFLSSVEEQELALAWQMPRPALLQAQKLVERSLSRCAIDTSDGLKASCRQIGEASGLNVILEPDQIPIAPIVKKVAKGLNVDPLALAVGDSVDFRLVFTAGQEFSDEIQNEFEKGGWPLWKIGRLEFGDEELSGVYLRTAEGLTEVPGVEWAQSDKMSIDKLRSKRDSD